MSVEVTAWVLNQNWGSPFKRFVALAIADVICDVHNSVSMDHICQFTEMGEKEIRKALVELEEEGSVCVFPTHDPRRIRVIFPECLDLIAPITAPSERKLFRARLVSAFKQQCVHCGLTGDEQCGPDGRVWTVDRIIPGAVEGTYRISNVTLSCFTCNVRRGRRLLAEPVSSLAEREKGERPWGERRYALKIKLTRRRPASIIPVPRTAFSSPSRS